MYLILLIYELWWCATCPYMLRCTMMVLYVFFIIIIWNKMIILSNDEVHALTVYRAKPDHLNYLSVEKKKKRKKHMTLKPQKYCVEHYNFMCRHFYIFTQIQPFPSSGHNSQTTTTVLLYSTSPFHFAPKPSWSNDTHATVWPMPSGVDS